MSAHQRPGFGTPTWGEVGPRELYPGRRQAQAHKAYVAEDERRGRVQDISVCAVSASFQYSSVVYGAEMSVLHHFAVTYVRRLETGPGL